MMRGDLSSSPELQKNFFPNLERFSGAMVPIRAEWLRRFPKFEKSKELESFLNQVRRGKGGSKRQACLSSTCSVRFDDLFQNLLALVLE